MPRIPVLAGAVLLATLAAQAPAARAAPPGAPAVDAASPLTVPVQGWGYDHRPYYPPPPPPPGWRPPPPPPPRYYYPPPPPPPVYYAPPRYYYPPPPPPPRYYRPGVGVYFGF